jgi:hypothetical protein
MDDGMKMDLNLASPYLTYLYGTVEGAGWITAESTQDTGARPAALIPDGRHGTVTTTPFGGTTMPNFLGG